MEPDLRPLAGIRVLDLSVVWAGPFLAQLLAGLGAEVIKVENVHAWQPSTRGEMARALKADSDENSAWPTGWPDHDPGERPWERNPWALPIWQDRKSVTIDLTRPTGQAYFHRLLEKADVVWENNVPSTIEKLHLAYEELTQYRPDLVMARAPAFGLWGDYKNRRGFGVHIEAFIGHTVLRGYEDMDASANTMIFAGDYHTASVAAFSIIAALEHRDRTGKGQLIEIAQAENSSQMFPQAIMDRVLNGRVAGTIGNRDVDGHVPNGVYPCRGDDRWIALTVATNDEWRALCRVMDRPDLGTDPQFQTQEGRDARRDAIDAAVEAFTRTQDHLALMYRLQSAGVPAGAVLDPRDAVGSPQLWARGFWERIHHEFTGTYEWPGQPFRLPLSGRPPVLPPPGLGEHNEYVYREIIGVSAEEYEGLVASGEIGVEFDASIP